MALPPALRLIFIRHGETDWNFEGRLQGQQDTPINARGRDQALAAGRAIKHWLGAEAQVALDKMDFVASPLLRTRETMKLVCAGLARPHQFYRLDARLKELSFGRWEGMTWREVKEIDPAGARARKADKWGFVPPGGESYAMLAERVAPWLASLARDCLVVSHGGVARVLLHLLAGVAGKDACDAEIAQGRALVFAGSSCEWV